jgi:uncharacterized protein (DUF1330 family)
MRKVFQAARAAMTYGRRHKANNSSIRETIMRHKFLLTLAAGIALGAAAIQALHAQAKPPIYVVNEVDVTDPAGFKTYAAAQAKLIASHGGHYIIQGGKVTAMDGETPKRFTIYVFDNEDKMHAWRNDPAQKDVFDVRNKVAKFRTFAVEGLAN